MSDAWADVDGDGLGGQSPLFHAVNCNQNHCRPVMELLVMPAPIWKFG